MGLKSIINLEKSYQKRLFTPLGSPAISSGDENYSFYPGMGHLSGTPVREPTIEYRIY
jgi:hypothetical protein